MSLVASFLERIDVLLGEVPQAEHASIARLRLVARCRAGVGAEDLAARPVHERLGVLAAIMPAAPATPELAEVARRALFGGGVGDDAVAFAGAAPDATQRMLAVWAGASPEAAGWRELSQPDRELCIATLIAAGTPARDGFDAFMHALPNEADREVALIAWCRARDWSASEAENAWVVHTTRPMVRLEAMASVLARTTASRIIAEEWIGVADRAWQSAPRDNLGRALSDARFSGVLAAAGDLPSAEGLLGHALAGAERASDPNERALIYRVALEAAAGIAVHDARGAAVEPWLRAVEKLTNDKGLWRHRDAFFEARTAAVRTLARAALTGGELAVDRGQQVLKELCRRLPERWLDLLHHATVASLLARSKRSTEVVLMAVADALKRDGLPAAAPGITLEECLRLLTPAAPERVLAIGDRLPHTLERATWWATAVAHVAEA